MDCVAAGNHWLWLPVAPRWYRAVLQTTRLSFVMSELIDICNELEEAFNPLFKTIDDLKRSKIPKELKPLLLTLGAEKDVALRESLQSIHQIKTLASMTESDKKSGGMDGLIKLTTRRGSTIGANSVGTGKAEAYRILYEVASNTDHSVDRRKEIAKEFTREEISRIIKFFNDSFEFAKEDLGFGRKKSTVKKRRKGGLTKERSLVSAGDDDDEDIQVTSQSVVVFGSINMDLMTTAPTFPIPNSNHPGVDFQTLHGGKGANEAVACGRLDVPTYLIGRVGMDDFGRVMMSALSEDTNVDGVSFDHDETTGVAMVIKAADTKLKTTSTCLAANVKVDNNEVETFKGYLHSPSMGIAHTLFQLEVSLKAVAKAAELAHNAGKSVTIRASPLTSRSSFPSALWKHAHFIIANESEAILLLTEKEAAELKLDKRLLSIRQCAQVAEKILKAHPALIAIVILTPFGVVTRLKISAAEAFQHEDFDVRHVARSPTRHQTLALPHFPAKIVDVIGAGDALSGAFVAALAWGCSVPHALVWGQIALAKSMEVAGAQQSMPTLMELRRYMASMRIGVHCQWMSEDDNGPNIGVAQWPLMNPKIHPSLTMLEDLLYTGSSTASSSKFGETLEALLQDHSDGDLIGHINDPIDFQGQTLLHLAVLHSDLSAVCALVEIGASITAKDGYGVTVLDRAISMYKKYRQPAGAVKSFKRSAIAIDETAALIKVVLLALWKVKHFTSSHAADPSPWPFKGTYAELKETPVSIALESDWSENWLTICLNLMMLTVLVRASKNMRLSPISSKYKPLANVGAHLATVALESVQKTPEKRQFQLKWLNSNAATSKVLGSVNLIHAAAYCQDVALMRLGHSLPVDFTMQQLNPEKSDVYRGPVRSASSESFDHLPPEERDEASTKVYWWGRANDISRNPLHFAALSSAHECASQLLEWGMDIYDHDEDNLTAVDYCPDHNFARRLEQLGLVSDTFISVGHTQKTDDCTRTIAETLEQKGATVWWDKNPKRGIQSGSSWTGEISRAMKHTKTAIIMLTKKWIASEFCLAEGKLALAYNKPIFTVLPPVPEKEQATLADIPTSNPLYAALSHKQFFDFRHHDPAELPSLLDKLHLAIVKDGRAVRKSASVKSQRNDLEEGLTNMMLPSGPLRRSLKAQKSDFVFIACGQEPSLHGKNFAEMLGTKLNASGVPVVIAYVVPESNADRYWTAVNERVQHAALVLGVLEENGDPNHMCNVLEIASQKQTPVVIVPYSKLSNSAGTGLSYTAAFSSTKSVPFTDWIGHEGGFSEHSTIFGETFNRLLRELDDELMAKCV